MQQPTCQMCGKSLRDAKFTLCYECNQKQRQSGAASAPSGRPALPENYLKNAYLDEGHLRDELITIQPLQLAQAFERIGLTTGQLRRFYTHARQLGQRLERNEPFQSVRPALLELKPLVADAVGRARNNGNKDYELFKNFIDRNVELAAQSKENLLKGFLPHFQYVVAYFTYLNPRDTRG